MNNHYKSYRHYTIATGRSTPYSPTLTANWFPWPDKVVTLLGSSLRTKNEHSTLGEERGEMWSYLARADYITLQILAMALKRHRCKFSVNTVLITHFSHARHAWPTRKIP